MESEEKITYLRTGRKVRATGTVIDHSPTGAVKVKPSREDWGAIWLTPEEIEAGKIAPPIVPRTKKEAAEPPPPRPRRKKIPVPEWKAAIDDGRAFVTKYTGDSLMTKPCLLIDRLAAVLEQTAGLFSPTPQSAA